MPSATSRLSGTRVLIVDDDRDVLQSIDAAFRSEGAETVLAEDGNEAIAMVLEHSPDLVILDAMLPGRSGFLALEKIKGRADSPLVVMVTANEGKRHKAYAESLGADRYLYKPVALDSLLQTSGELLLARDAEEQGLGPK